MQTQTRILLTGATGNIGTELVKKLAATDNVLVRAAVRSAHKADTIRALGAEVVEMDMRNPKTFPAAFHEVHKVFILTPFTNDFDEMTRTLCDAAVQAGTVTYIVKQSVIGAREEAPLHASRLHARAEKYIEATGIPFTFIRPTAFAQQFAGGFPWLYQQGDDTFYLPIGEGKVAWIDVRDIATLAAHSFTTPGHEGKIYNITGPAPVSCAEVAEMVSSVTGRSMTYVDMPMETYTQRMAAFGADQYTIDQMTIIFGDMKEGWLAHVSNEFEQATGQKSIPFADFVRDYAAVWKAL